MKKAAIALTLTTLLSASVQADTLLGVYFGGQVWDNEAEGVFGESTTQSDFNLKDEQQGSFFVAVEHPLPFLPNVKLAHTSLDTDGNTTLTTDFEFNDQTFTANTSVDAVFDVSYNDYTFYYELFDNDLLTFDFGLTARDLDGDVKVADTGNTQSASRSVSEIVPMVYSSAIIGLPFTDWNLFAEGNYLTFDDHTLYDYQVGVSYALTENFALDVNLTAGYRAVKFELDDLDDFYADLEFKGLFAGVIMHF
ncbi:TIGR04219 family outer membrane beta-barrel protein [Thalassomonas actiniarum]|uniref:TIGR04219 family outer membrane beta-barrel protein n=1 Tax=Thalassomonas actiniarum TaxID=485447 RepID=A0AAE9YQB8_9GAMM|nr:TIGR04219 family outer membrane beta-barrel protein [Thalassomonas actiniarum]WDD98324.1 TIGR04219 family outer membrane beta-barrel protein [Thalassomonas actiniarum]